MKRSSEEESGLLRVLLGGNVPRQITPLPAPFSTALMADPHSIVSHPRSGFDTARVEALCKAGAGLRQQGRLAQAVRVLAEALRLDPRHRPSLHALGATLAELRSWDGAARVYERTAKLFPEDAEARAGLQRALRESGSEKGRSAAAPPAPASKSGILVPASAPRHGSRYSGERLLKQARWIGLPLSLLVIGTHALVGFGTGRFWMGVSAAALAALALAGGGSLLFPQAGKRSVFWGLLQGIGLGAAAAALLMLGLTAVAWLGHDHHAG